MPSILKSIQSVLTICTMKLENHQLYMELFKETHKESNLDIQLY